MCLSDMSYVEEANRIPPEPTPPIPSGSNLGEELQSDIEDSSGPSSSESEEENTAAEKLKDSDDNGNQSGDEGGNGGVLAEELNADDLLVRQDLPEIGDGNANESDQKPSQGTPDVASNALGNQSSMPTATSQAATQPLPPPDSLESLQSPAPEHSQQEQPQEQARSNAQEQMQVV